MPGKFRKKSECSNCHKKIGNVNYCPNCGQANTHKQIPLKQILKELLGDVFTFDSKFFRSIWPLVGRPGHLTNEYINGRRISYILPLRLYIFTTFLFFFVLSLSTAIDPNRIDEQRKHQITEDSLRQFLKPYSREISSRTKERLMVDLSNTYRLEKRNDNKSNSTFPDSLKKYLMLAKPNLIDSVATSYARQMYRGFKFYKKKEKDTSDKDHYEMHLMFDDFRFPNEGRERFFSWLDSSYYFKKVVWKNQNINITFSGEDTVQSAFMRELEAKAEYMFAQGDRGMDLFFSELVRQIPKIMFFLLPAFALLLKLFFLRQKIFYFNHLIFSLHIHSLVFMYLIFAVFFPDGWVITATIVAIWIHTFIAMKNVYRQKWWLLILKLDTILLLYFFILVFSFIGLSVLAVYFA